MTYQIINPSKIISSEGFSIWVKNPLEIHYYESDGEIIIPGEMLSGDYKLLLSLSVVKPWAKPCTDVMLTTADRERIMDNIYKAHDYLGWRPMFD